MRIVLVGNRDGKAVVNWPGVLTTTLICSALAMLGVGLATFMLPLPWFSPVSIVLAAVMGVSMVGTWVLLSLRLPVEKLTPLE